MQEFFSLLSWRLFTAQHVSEVFPPVIRNSVTAVAASGFTFVSWWQSCCVRGRAGREVIFPLRLDNGRSPHVHVHQRLQINFGAPDDERYAARNMLSFQ